MVTDRRIICSNGRTSLELSSSPFILSETEGFDRIESVNVTSQGFDQDGATLVNSYVKPRDLKIKGYIKAATTMQMQTLHDKLNNLFIPKTDITINHYYGGQSRVITARVEKTPKFAFTNVSTVQKYEITLLAPQPYFRDSTETLVQIANIVGHFHFPLHIDVDNGTIFGLKSAVLIADAFNRSSIKVGMKFVFVASGTVTNPQLFNVNTREFFKLNCTMEAGETITVVTGEDKTVTREIDGTTMDYIGKIDIASGGNSFLELEPGDNLFRYGADDGEDVLETRIYFYNKYPGV